VLASEPPTVASAPVLATPLMFLANPFNVPRINATTSAIYYQMIWVKFTTLSVSFCIESFEVFMGILQSSSTVLTIFLSKRAEDTF